MILIFVCVSVSTGWPEEVFKSSEEVWWDDTWPLKQRPLELTTNGIWDHLRSLASPWEQLHSQVRFIQSLTLKVFRNMWHLCLFFVKNKKKNKKKKRHLCLFFSSDLALRNCLLTSDLTVRIGDYGLSHNQYKVFKQWLNCIALQRDFTYRSGPQSMS